MAKADTVFMYIGTYTNEAAAHADYDIVKDLHTLGAVGTYDAAVVSKKETARSTSTRMRPPPVTVPGAGRGDRRISCSGPVPAVPARRRRDRRRVGRREKRPRVEGHVAQRRQGAYGEFIDDGEAALVIVGESTIEGGHREGRPQGPEACRQGARRQLQGHRQGDQASGRRSQLTKPGPSQGTARAGQAATPALRRTHEACSPVHRPGVRKRLLVPAAVLIPVLSGLAAGCSRDTEWVRASLLDATAEGPTHWRAYQTDRSCIEVPRTMR